MNDDKSIINWLKQYQDYYNIIQHIQNNEYNVINFIKKIQSNSHEKIFLYYDDTIVYDSQFAFKYYEKHNALYTL